MNHSDHSYQECPEPVDSPAEPEVWVSRSPRAEAIAADRLDEARKTLAAYTDRDQRAHYMVGILSGAIASSDTCLSGDLLAVAKAYVAVNDEMRGAS